LKTTNGRVTDEITEKHKKSRKILLISEVHTLEMENAQEGESMLI
jgi:hypothetical protein